MPKTKNSSSTKPSLKKQRTRAPDYNPEFKGETMPIHFSRGIPEIFLDYLGGDIQPISGQHKNTVSLSKQYEEFKLFGRKLSDLMQQKTLKVSNLILQGEEKQVEEALAIVRENPLILRCAVETRDLLGRRVRGTPLQIAAMESDINLIPDITQIKPQGMVKRLIEASNLSQDEIIKQLKCVISDEARLANETKKNSYYMLLRNLVTLS